MLDIESKGTVCLHISDFNLDDIFGCGQCFRWRRKPDGSYTGVAHGRPLSVSQEGDTLLLGCGEDDLAFWGGYFDLRRDYGKIKESLSQDTVLKKAVSFAPGIRILRQEPWEALCSFLVSQNNNIPRIRGIIERLCCVFGGEIEGTAARAFPAAPRLAALSESDLKPLGLGYRTPYVLSAARKVAEGKLDLAAVAEMPLAQARAELMKLRGVGPKVAECVLLFGFGRLEAFPVDIWVKRVLAQFYPEGFPPELAHLGGVAQQYLFHYARCCPACDLVH